MLPSPRSLITSLIINERSVFIRVHQCESVAAFFLAGHPQPGDRFAHYVLSNPGNAFPPGHCPPPPDYESQAAWPQPGQAQHHNQPDSQAHNFEQGHHTQPPPPAVVNSVYTMPAGGCLINVTDTGYSSFTTPFLMAKMAAWVRSLTSSLRKMLVKWFLTVFSLIHMTSAISLFE